MSGEQLVADAELISKFVAKFVAGQSTVNEVELAERIGEIELETQILGASFLKVHIIDPELTLTNAGWLHVDSDGRFQTVTVEFPEGSGWKWGLCAAEISTEITSANLEVTFQSSSVVKLREYWGPKQAPPGTRTRAQFVRDLLAEAKIPTVIPGLNIVQPVEEEEKNEAGTVIVQSDIEKQKTEEHVNKSKGAGHGAYKIEGKEPTRQQLADVNTAMATANRLKAPPGRYRSTDRRGHHRIGLPTGSLRKQRSREPPQRHLAVRHHSPR